MYFVIDPYNSFTKDDYNKLNSNAKEFIIQTNESELLESARKQSNQALEMMRFMVENAGWELEIKKGNIEEPEILK